MVPNPGATETGWVLRLWAISHSGSSIPLGTRIG
jgi:hypothetical protein